MDPILRKLYISHFFNTWDERMFEFAAYMLIIDVFKDTLLPSSMYGFITTAVGIMFNSHIGNMVDKWSRLDLVVTSIFAQKITIFLSCVCLFIMDSYYTLMLVVMFSSISRLASIANTIAIEKDWVMVIYGDDLDKLSNVNSMIRRIDLLSKMIALIGLFNVIGLVIEFLYTRQIFYGAQKLSTPKVVEDNQSHRSWIVGWDIYIHDKTFLPSVSVAMLYFTVLSFSGTMISYMKWFGYSDILVASIRAIAVVMGLVATFIQPIHARRVGIVRAGLHFIWMQAITLLLVVGTFYMDYSAITTMLMLSGVALSRIGLIFGYQYTLCNAFDLMQSLYLLLYILDTQE